ncbi:MAG: DUF4131 domain-containing protein, partial [Acidobacteriaceae bacterium]
MAPPSPTSAAPLETSHPPRRTRGYKPAPLRATRHTRTLEHLTFASAPMLLAAGAFVLGILDARWVWHPPLLFLVAAFLAIALTLLALRRAQRTLLLPLMLLWFATGQFSAHVAPVHAPSSTLLPLADGLQRSVTGTVVAFHAPRTETRSLPFRDGSITEQTQQIDLLLDHVEDFTADRDWQAAVSGGLRLSVYARAEEQLPRVHCGQRLTINLQL